LPRDLARRWCLRERVPVWRAVSGGWIRRETRGSTRCSGDSLEIFIGERLDGGVLCLRSGDFEFHDLSIAERAGPSEGRKKLQPKEREEDREGR